MGQTSSNPLKFDPRKLKKLFVLSESKKRHQFSVSYT